MKKLFALLMALSLVMASGCASKDEAPADGENAGTPMVEEPVKGEDAETPAEGEDAETPAEGEDAKDPAEGEDAQKAEEQTITGTLGEMKDFMFEITDEKGDTYALAFEGEKPEGLADFKTGDKVTVTYTGELSVVDPFTGTIVSVAAAE